MSNCRAIQNEGRQNLFRFVLQSEAAALRVVGAAGRTLLGDHEAVLSRNRGIGSHDSFKPEEFLFRLSANHTFYCGGSYRHSGRFWVVLRSDDCLAIVGSGLAYEFRVAVFGTGAPLLFLTAIASVIAATKHLESIRNSCVTVPITMKLHNNYRLRVSCFP